MASSLQERNATINSYVTSARIRGRHCSTLTDKLVVKAPPDLSADERAALAKVQAAGEAVDEIVMGRQRSTEAALVEPRQEHVRAWLSLLGGLRAVAGLPADLGPEKAEADLILFKLFPHGIEFATSDTWSVRGAAKLLLARIADEGYGPRIDALVSPLLRRHVANTYAALNLALGVDPSAPPPAAPTRSLAEAAARYSFFVAGYARALSVGIDPDDDARFTRFLQALAPIDEIRVAAKGSDEDDDEHEDVTPVPADDDTPPPYPEKK